MSDLQIYVEAVRIIKEAILRSRYRATSAANKEQLSLSYGIGCYVSKNSRDGFWGKGAIEKSASNYKRSSPDFVGSRQPISNLYVNSMRRGARI